MGQCKYCGKKGFFLSVDRDGLCKSCAPALLMQVQQSIRVIKESEKIINRSKRINTRISRCDTILVHLKRLIELEKKGIPTLSISPSELFKKVTDERNKILAESKSDKVETDKFIKDFEEEERKKKQAGSVNGKYYTEYAEQVKQLKREGKHQKAIELLLKLIDALESEAKVDKSYGGDGFTAPWYYEQLAIIYRKEKRYNDEVGILERHQEQNNWAGSKKLKERLKKARELRDKKKSN